ncbi:MAG: MarR family transcriptional regulator [Gemmatimonadota bacterium]
MIELPEFQRQVVAFTRAFGWHRPDETPCGQPVPIAEAHALLELSRTPGLTQKELGTALNLRKSTVSRLVKKLERRGWAARNPCRDDGRAIRVSLTDAGVRTAGTMASARAVKMASILEAIPAGERAMVISALGTLVEATRNTAGTESRPPDPTYESS